MDFSYVVFNIKFNRLNFLNSPSQNVSCLQFLAWLIEAGSHSLALSRSSIWPMCRRCQSDNLRSLENYFRNGPPITLTGVPPFTDPMPGTTFATDISSGAPVRHTQSGVTVLYWYLPSSVVLMSSS